MLTKHRLIERMIDVDGSDRFENGLPERVINLDGGERFQNRLSSKTFRCQIKNQQDGSVDLLVYGYVGDPETGLDSRGVAEFLAAHPNAPIRVRVDSPGGFAYDGITIHNALIKHPAEVSVEIEGIAASAASIIAAAGDPVKITGNASIFIHRAMGLAIGNEGDLRDLAEFLAGLDGQIARTLAAKSGQTTERMLELMRGAVDGTSFDAEAAVKIGLADEILPIRPENQAGNAAPADPWEGQRLRELAAIARQAALGAEAGQRLVELMRGMVDGPAEPPTAAEVVREALAAEAAERLAEQQRLWELSLGRP